MGLDIDIKATPKIVCPHRMQVSLQHRGYGFKQHLSHQIFLTRIRITYRFNYKILQNIFSKNELSLWVNVKWINRFYSRFTEDEYVALQVTSWIHVVSNIQYFTPGSRVERGIWNESREVLQNKMAYILPPLMLFNYYSNQENKVVWSSKVITNYKREIGGCWF